MADTSWGAPSAVRCQSIPTINVDPTVVPVASCVCHGPYVSQSRRGGRSRLAGAPLVSNTRKCAPHASWPKGWGYTVLAVSSPRPAREREELTVVMYARGCMYDS